MAYKFHRTTEMGWRRSASPNRTALTWSTCTESAWSPGAPFAARSCFGASRCSTRSTLFQRTLAPAYEPPAVLLRQGAFGVEKAPRVVTINTRGRLVHYYFVVMEGGWLAMPISTQAGKMPHDSSLLARDQMRHIESEKKVLKSLSKGTSRHHKYFLV